MVILQEKTSLVAHAHIRKIPYSCKLKLKLDKGSYMFFLAS